MNCQDAREWFSALLDGGISLTERALVETHLARCADCRRELEQFQKMVKMLHRVQRPRAPLGFVGRVLGEIRPAGWLKGLRSRLPSRALVGVPAGAVAALIVAGMAVYLFQRSPELPQVVRQEAAPARSVAPMTQPGSLPAPPPPVLPRADTQAAEPMPTQTQGGPTRLPMESASPPPQLPAPGSKAVALPGEPMPTQASPSPAQPLSSARAPAGGRASHGETSTAAGPAPAVSAPSLPPRAAPSPPAGTEALADRNDKAEGSKLKVQEQSRFESRSKESTTRSVPSGPSQVPAAPSAPSFARKAEESPATAPSPSRARESEPARPAPASPLAAAKRALSSVDVVGRLSVKDREAAERDLGALLARVRGAQTGRQRGFSATVVDAVVPQSGYGEFTQGLTRIGSWQPEAGRSPLPDPVRVTIRLTE